MVTGIVICLTYVGLDEAIKLFTKTIILSVATAKLILTAIKGFGSSQLYSI